MTPAGNVWPLLVRRLSRQYGFTPEQVGQLTLAQAAVYLTEEEELLALAQGRLSLPAAQASGLAAELHRKQQAELQAEWRRHGLEPDDSWTR